MLQTRVIPPADGAYQYPLLIKRLLMSGARYEKPARSSTVTSCAIATRH
jgi:hypothetical protein